MVVAKQLDQLVTYLDRPGVTELVFCVDKPITMRTAKGVMNVTGRPLGSEQLAALVRGTPLEALIADENQATPTQLAIGTRDVVVVIERKADTVTVRLQAVAIEKAPGPRMKVRAKATSTAPRTKGRSSPPTSSITSSGPGKGFDELPRTRAPSEPGKALEELPRPRAQPSAPPAAPKPADELPRPSRTRTEPRRFELVGPAKHPAPVAAPPPVDATSLATPARTKARSVGPIDIDSLPPTSTRTKAPSVGPQGPPGLDLDLGRAGWQPFDREPRPPVTNPLRIDVSNVGQHASISTEPPKPSGQQPVSGEIHNKSSGAKRGLRIDVSIPDEELSASTRDASGIIALERGPAIPLDKNARSLEVLGLPADVATVVTRERGLVLITSPHGHGKTSTLAALFELIDRTQARHVVTIDELRDRESIDLMLTAAESGYLVLATLTAATPKEALDQLLDHYPGMAHSRVKTRIVGALVALIAKRLPPTPTDVVTGDALRALLD